MATTPEQDKAYHDAALEEVLYDGMTPRHIRFIASGENASADHAAHTPAWYACFRGTHEFLTDIDAFADGENVC